MSLRTNASAGAELTSRGRTTANDWLPGSREALNEGGRRRQYPDLIDADEFWVIAGDCWDYSALTVTGFHGIYAACRYVFARQLTGDLVECGVYLGGSVMFVAEMCKRPHGPDRACGRQARLTPGRS